MKIARLLILTLLTCILPAGPCQIAFRSGDLKATADAFPDRVASPEPQVKLIALDASALTFEVWLWIGDPWRQVSVAADFNLALVRALRGAGVVIAFPQLDVHVIEPASAADAAAEPPLT